MPGMVQYVLRLPESDRTVARQACRVIYGQSLNSWLCSQIRRLIAEAKESRPDTFGAGIIELKPVDRTLLLILSREGRSTDADLANETGLSLTTVRRSLKRLVDQQVVYIREQGGKTEGASGFRKKIYISHLED